MFTQEVIELILQLRSGVRPTVVVFYDGINDVISLVQNGRSGLPQNVANRQRDFRAGRDLFPWRNRLQDDVGVALATGWVLVQRLQLVQRIRRPLLQEEKRSTPESLVQELLADYVATIEIVESLAAAYGFRPVYIWQPTIHTTTKTLSPYEGRLMEFIESNGPHPEIKRVHELMATNIDSAMSGMVPGRFLNLTCLFAQTTEPVFADAIGHTYERPNLEIVGAFLPVVESLITGGITTYDPPESSSSVVPQCG